MFEETSGALGSCANGSLDRFNFVLGAIKSVELQPASSPSPKIPHNFELGEER
jgi:hypothetical protein